jgi:hypothetical protein
MVFNVLLAEHPSLLRDIHRRLEDHTVRTLLIGKLNAPDLKTRSAPREFVQRNQETGSQLSRRH